MPNPDADAPRLPDSIRELRIEDADLLSCNVSTFVRLFSPSTLKPSEAKQLRGSVVLTSAWCDRDARPNWEISEWRGFVQRLFDELPHFSYFIVNLDQVYLGVVLTLLPREAVTAVSGGAIRPQRFALVTRLIALLNPVVSYCEQIFDAKDLVVRDLLRPFPMDVAAEVVAKLSP